MSVSLEEMVGRKSDQYVAERKKVEVLRKALSDLVDALAANDEDGLTEFADVMVAARAALKI